MDIIDRLGGTERRLRSGRAIMLLSAMVVLAVGATAGLMIWHNRQAELDEHLRGMNSMGIVLAEQTTRYAQVIDVIMQEVHSRVAALGLATPADFEHQLETPEVQRYLAERVTNVPQIDALVVIDANGRVVNWSRAEPVVHLDASDRDYYNYFKANNDSGLFIGSVSKGRATGRLSLFFARRISAPDGTFLGLILSIVDIRFLSEFYRSAGEPARQAVTLLRRDGMMLMRYPDPEAAIDVRLPPGSPWYRRVADGGGNYAAVGALDHVPNRVSVHPLRDYPLVVDVVMSEAEVFAQWHDNVVQITGFALAASLAISGLFWMLGRQFRRLADAAVRLSEGQQMLRAYAEMAADWFWEQDAHFRFKQVTASPFTGGIDDVGKTRWEIAGSAMAEEQWSEHKAMLDARLPFRNFQWERVGLNGERRFILVSGDPVFDRSGVFTGYRGTGREVTAEVESTARLAQANAELERGRQRFDAALSNITQGVCFFDGEQRLLLCNRRFGEIYGLPPEASRVGISIAEIADYRAAAGSAPDMSTPDYLEALRMLRAGKRPTSTVMALKNGRSVEICYQPMPDGGWVATHEDITERQRAEASVVFMAHHDALTRLPNRVLFRDRMEQAIAMAGRGTQFAVFCLDLDNFKQVNDTLGHPVGDGLLVAAADRLQACVREGDTVARLGGDEFAIIQLGIRQPDDAEVLASRILSVFRQPFDLAGHQVMAGVSIGVTVAPSDSVSHEALMRDADTALYLAKTEGRGTARFFEPEMDARIHQRRLLELDLQGSLERNELEVYYQPQINLIRNVVSGFEALLRWNHPVRGFVSPADFIPVAEETGTILAIGEWVLRAACFEARNWPEEISVAVNLSPVQFRRGDLVGVVQAALTASGLSPNRLELEITESVLLRDTSGTLGALHQLREMGICIALDDFGTGYSSLSYLRSFPFSKIKIDQSFVRDLRTNKESMSIIRAVTGLGQSLDIKTTAEGVETLGQLDWLREEGCTEVQGYFFSRPKPAREISSLITELHDIGEFTKSAIL